MTDQIEMPRRLFRKAVQQGRSERRGESYSGPYGESLSDVSTPLAVFVNSLRGVASSSSGRLEFCRPSNCEVLD